MPDKKTIEKARADKRAGKSASTQAGEFVHAEIDKIREGEHGARSTKQAIAIGLSEARRAGVDLPPPRKGRTSARTRKSAQYAYAAGQGKRAVKVDEDLRDGLERLVGGELVDKPVCGTHRSHCVRARWPETDLEQIECTDEQGTRSGGW